MLTSLRGLGGARLHLLPEHGRLNGLLSEAVYGLGATAGWASLFQSGVSEQRRTLASSGHSPALEDEPELTLPDDISLIARLNPQLRDVMEAHAEYTRASAKDALRLRLQELLVEQQQAHQQQQPSLETTQEDSNVTLQQQPLQQRQQQGGTPPLPPSPNVTKTALGRLRVDQLRGVLEEENADTRGNKDVLVQRLLALLAEREHQAGALLPGMDELEEGVVTRKQLAVQEKRARRRQQSHDTYGISEDALQRAQAAAVAKAQFATVFQPEEVADMLLEARAVDVCIIDVRHRCPFTDYMVIGTTRSQRMVHMLASGVLHQLKSRCKEVAPGVMPTIEGSKEDSEWMVVDAGSVVVHIFLEGYREEYDLEGLWGDRSRSNIRFLEPKQTVNTLHTIKA